MKTYIKYAAIGSLFFASANAQILDSVRLAVERFDPILEQTIEQWDTLHPSQTALVVMDYWPNIAPRNAMENAANLVQLARELGFTIIHLPNGGDIDDRVVPEPGEPVLGIFDLIDSLLIGSGKQISTLLYAGFNASQCVLFRSNGMMATAHRMPWLRMILIKDCTWTLTPLGLEWAVNGVASTFLVSSMNALAAATGRSYTALSLPLPVGRVPWYLVDQSAFNASTSEDAALLLVNLVAGHDNTLWYSRAKENNKKMLELARWKMQHGGKVLHLGNSGTPDSIALEEVGAVQLAGVESVLEYLAVNNIKSVFIAGNFINRADLQGWNPIDAWLFRGRGLNLSYVEDCIIHYELPATLEDQLFKNVFLCEAAVNDENNVSIVSYRNLAFSSGERPVTEGLAAQFENPGSSLLSRFSSPILAKQPSDFTVQCLLSPKHLGTYGAWRTAVFGTAPGFPDRGSFQLAVTESGDQIAGYFLFGDEWTNVVGGRVDSNSWHDVAIVYSAGENRVTTYVDGKFGSRIPAPHKNFPGIEMLYFGNSAGGAQPFWGNLGQVRILSKAMTQDEIINSMNRRTSICTDSLISLWSFSDSSATGLHDAVGGQTAVASGFTGPLFTSAQLPLNKTFPPVLASAPKSYAKVGSDYESALVASDPDSTCGGGLTYTLVRPDWMNIKGATGVLSGMPTLESLARHDTVLEVRTTDVLGETATFAFPIHLAYDNSIPSWNTMPANIAVEDSLYSFRSIAYDPDTLVGQSLSYMLLNAPSWLSIDTTDGVLTGVPSASDCGRRNVTLRVCDNSSGTRDTTISLEVLHRNHAPVFKAVTDTSGVEDELFKVQLNAGDPDSALFHDCVRYGFLDGPTWLTIDSLSGVLTGIPHGIGIRDTMVSVIAIDDSLASDTLNFSIHVQHVNHSPAISGILQDTTLLRNPPSAIIAREDSALSARTIASDSDSITFGDVVHYRLTAAPGWLSIDSLSGQLSGIPGGFDVGNRSISIQAFDGNGGIATQSFSLTVQHTNHSPIIATTGLATAVEDSIYRHTIHASDSDSSLFGDVVRYRLTVKPSWVAIDSTTGILNGTPSGLNARDTVVVVEAFDNKGGIDSRQFAIQVRHVNHNPAFVSGLASSATEDSLYQSRATASDVDSSMWGDMLRFSLHAAPSWVSIDSLTGLVRGIPAGKDVGDSAMTVVVSDGKGGSATQRYPIHVVHTNHVPAFSGETTLFAREDSLFRSKLYASDKDSVLFGDLVRYRLLTKPSWITIDSLTGAISGIAAGAMARDTVALAEAHDNKGGSATQQFAIKVQHVNHNPMFVSGPGGSATEDSTYISSVKGSDVDTPYFGDIVHYFISAAPSWVSIDSVTGSITGIPAGRDVKDTSITIRITDGNGGSALQSYPMHVAHTNHPPVIAEAVIPPVVEDSLFRYSPRVSDVDSALFGDVLRYRLLAAPSWVTVDSLNGAISGTPSGINARDTVVVLEAFDNKGGMASRQFAIQVRHVNHNPVFVSGLGSSATEDSLYQSRVTASDVDSSMWGDVLRFSLHTAPPWVSIDSISGMVRGIPAGKDVGDSAIVVVVSDGKGGSATQRYPIRVAHTNHPPMFFGSTAIAAIEDAKLKASVYASDSDSTLFGDVVRYRLLVTPGWVTVDSATGLLSGTPIGQDARDTIIVVEASDNKGGVSSQTYSLTVQHVNHAPVLAGLLHDTTLVRDASSTIVAREDVPFAVRTIASDSDSAMFGDRLSYQLSLHPNWLAIDSTTGVLSGIPGSSDPGNPIVEVIVEDGKGGVAARPFALSVIHTNHAPVLAHIPPVLFKEDSSAWVTLLPYATDSDNSVQSLRWSVSRGTADAALGLYVNFDSLSTMIQFTAAPEFNCSALPVYISVTDPLGAEAFDTVRVTIQSVNDPPVLAGIPTISILEDSSFVLRLAPYLSDPDDSISTMTWSVDLPDYGKKISFASLSSNSGKSLETVSVHRSEKSSIKSETDGLNSQPSIVDSLSITLEGAAGIMTFRGTANFWRMGMRMAIHGADPHGLVGSDTILVNILSVNDPPEISSAPDTFACLGARYTFHVAATDPDDTLLTYSMTGPSWLRVDSVGTIQGIPLEAGDFPIVIRVSDPQGAFDTLRYVLSVTVLKSVAGMEEGIPVDFLMHQNYPNPFNPSTTIRFGLPERSSVSIEVYNMLGQRVVALLESVLEAGYHNVNWRPSHVASGAYIIVLEGKGLVTPGRDVRIVKKAVLVR